MSYYWYVNINGRVIHMKAVKAHTAVTYALKYERDPTEAVIKFKRLEKVRKVICPECKAKYDSDQQAQHAVSWKHESFLKQKLKDGI